MKKLILAAVAALCFSSTAAHAQSGFDYQIRLSKGDPTTIYGSRPDPYPTKRDNSPLHNQQVVQDHPTIILCQDSSKFTRNLYVNVNGLPFIMNKGGCIAVKGASIQIPRDGPAGTNAIPDGATMILNVKIIQ